MLLHFVQWGVLTVPMDSTAAIVESAAPMILFKMHQPKVASPISFVEEAPLVLTVPLALHVSCLQWTYVPFAVPILLHHLVVAAELTATHMSRNGTAATVLHFLWGL